MIVFWGKRELKKHCGYAVDWLAIDGLLDWVSVTEVRQQRRLYLVVPMGPASVIRYEGRPLRGTKVVYARPPRFFDKFVPSPGGEPHDAVGVTTSRILGMYQALIEREALIQSGDADDAQRLESLADRFSAVAFDAASSASKSTSESISAVLTLVLIVVGSTAAILIHGGNHYGWGLAVAALALFVVLIIRATRVQGDTEWKLLKDALLDSLEAMRATPDEIDSLLATNKRLGAIPKRLAVRASRELRLRD